VRRFVSLVVLLFFAIPFGISVTGCHKGTVATVYCNGSDSGPVVGQVSTITLSPTLATTGESLNYGQIGQALSATATDCKGNSVSVGSYTYSSTSNFNSNSSTPVFADINPRTGQVCGGTWNRNVGGGVADYTTCTPPATLPDTSTSAGYLAYVTATAAGATSNAIPVYVHPTVTGIVLGGPTPGAANGVCPSNATDIGTDCCPPPTTGTPVVATAYTGSSCLSQGKTGQLIARVYANGTTSPANNITCQVGHLSYAALNASNVVSIDQNGVATAGQPGSTTITANIANSSTATAAGFFSTCPPASITLTAPGQTGNSFTESINNTQPLTATVLDTLGNPITGLGLEYNSTTPQTIPAGTGSVTPVYPGTATITAVCQPGTCNPSAFSQIGLLGNGKPITSNGITVTATGTSSTVIYMGSKNSQYVQPYDFTTNSTISLLKLSYVPNSMVITQDGSSIFLGSPQGLMTVNTSSNSQISANQNVPGIVLAVSPDGSSVVVTDPSRQTVSLYSPSSSGVTTSYGAVGVAAKWSPDSTQVYIVTNSGVLLTHSAFTNWQVTALGGADPIYTDVAVMVPSIGAYFAGPNATEGRSYCSTTTLTGSASTPPQTANNVFAPLADEDGAITDRIAATTDGNHILGATASGTPRLSDIALSTGSNLPTGATQPGGPVACTTATAAVTFPSTFTAQPLSSIGVSAIDAVVPASNSALAFVLYDPTANGNNALPQYVPSTKTLSYIALGNGASAASAPISGVFSTDNLFFYVGTGTATSISPCVPPSGNGTITCPTQNGITGIGGTSADNDLHIFSITGTTAKETSIISTNLPHTSGTGYAAVTFVVQKPKKSTS
jgi:hypothetical protein